MSQVIAAAAELDIPARIVQRAWQISELASFLDCDADALRRLLRALASIGWCTIGDDGIVRATGGLTGDNARSFRPLALWWGRYRWPVWGDLLHSVRTGESAVGNVAGRIGMHELQQDPAAAQTFHEAMAAVTQRVAQAVLETCDLSDSERIVDVGGGHGELLGAVLRKHPAARGVLFDLPHALDGARQHLRQAHVLDRCELVSGSFFDRVPAAAAAYILKAILHDWPDADSLIILRRCREACAPGARLIVVEQILPDRIERSGEHQRATISDLNMLVMLGGRERTIGEFRSLFERAGFQLESVRAAAMGFSVIEARAG
jgi:hypothetical protein